MIAALVDGGAIKPAYDFVAARFSPPALTCALARSPIGYAPVSCRSANSVAKRIGELKLHEFALTEGAVLETACVYIVPLIESLELPGDIAAATNPKSSTGRLDVFTRVIRR